MYYIPAIHIGMEAGWHGAKALFHKVHIDPTYFTYVLAMYVAKDFSLNPSNTLTHVFSL